MLKADRIAELIRKGQVAGPDDDPFVVAPSPDPDKLEESGAASVDLRLGTWFVTLRPARLSHLSAQSQANDGQLARTQYVPVGTEFYLHPGRFVLGVTLEWLRFPRDLAGYVIGKSSWGRRGLIIATATGVHPGFSGCLTLELTNVGEIPISIIPGMEICQVCVHRAESAGNKSADQSMFVGRRKPVLGKVVLDEFVRDLVKAAKPMEQ